MIVVYRTEYPQPQFQRKHWQNLNGQWQFAFDDADEGQRKQWYREHDWSEHIEVPFAYQSQLSGISDTTDHAVVWYQRTVTSQAESGETVLLHFGAVDYEADIWLDGQFIGHHQGGHTSFSFDITNQVSDSAEHTLTVRVWDPIHDEEVTRGKQSWTGRSEGIWYTNTTGIWQTVWLEYVPQTYLESVQYFPDISAGTITIKGTIKHFVPGTQVQAVITFKDDPVTETIVTPEIDSFTFTADVFAKKIFRSGYHNDGRLWTPEHPHLFAIRFTTKTPNGEQDVVDSYFGMREVRTESGMVFLNNRPYYQKLVLDQGYWSEGLLTAPSDEAFKKDIKLAKAMGFNGARLHQKVEDPRFLYWADQLGFICWGECASAPVFSARAESALYAEWQEIIARDFNHPAIITWVPLNESWGVRSIHDDRQQQHFSQALYHLIHSLDPTRLVQSNDGWEQTETDICAIHNYSHGESAESPQYAYFKDSLSTWQKLLSQPPGSFDIFAKGFAYAGQPILLTEFGGIGYNKADADAGWGYTGAHSDAEFRNELQRIFTAVASSKSLNGFCYTQLYDTEQEVNGLMTYDRTPKIPVKEIHEILDYFVPSYIESQAREHMLS